jgi:hypothetical protein
MLTTKEAFWSEKAEMSVEKIELRIPVKLMIRVQNRSKPSIIISASFEYDLQHTAALQHQSITRLLSPSNIAMMKRILTLWKIHLRAH